MNFDQYWQDRKERLWATSGIKHKPMPEHWLSGIVDEARLAYEFASKEVEATPNPWKEAVIEACTIDCIGWDEDDPVKTIRDLCAWEVLVALDPAVSSEAQALIDKGRVEATQAVERAEPVGCLEALREIVDPIAKMRSELKAGEVLNGPMAIALSRDPEYLKGIARTALEGIDGARFERAEPEQGEPAASPIDQMGYEAVEILTAEGWVYDGDDWHRPALTAPISNVTKTAPERIWLNLFTHQLPDDVEFPSDHEDVTWADQEVGDDDVAYVRADLVGPALATVEPRQPITKEWCMQMAAIEAEAGHPDMSVGGAAVEPEPTPPELPRPYVPSDEYHPVAFYTADQMREFWTRGFAAGRAAGEGKP